MANNHKGRARQVPTAAALVARREPERGESDRAPTGCTAGPELTAHPDPEVVALAKRRSFTADYNNVTREIERRRRAGPKGPAALGHCCAVKGLYSSLLATRGANAPLVSV